MRSAASGSNRSRCASASASWFLRQGIVVALAVEILFFWSQSDKFMTTSNVELVLIQISAVAIIAAPLGLLLLSGYIDFAVGSTAGLAGAVMGLYLDEQGGNPAIGVLIAIGVGAGVGAAQGALATKLTLSPIIITLGFYTAVRGLVFVVSDGKVTNRFGDAFQDIGRADVPGIGVPVPVAIAGPPLLLAWLFHTRTKWGRHVVGLGVNAEASRRAGISLNVLPFFCYVASGACAGLAAVIIASRLDAAPPTLGDGLEIDLLHWDTSGHERGKHRLCAGTECQLRRCVQELFATFGFELVPTLGRLLRHPDVPESRSPSGRSASARGIHPACGRSRRVRAPRRRSTAERPGRGEAEQTTTHDDDVGLDHKPMV